MLVGAFALACAGPAFATSPQRIYKDLADNGRLDGRYRDADIARAFNLERVVRTDQRRPAQAEAQAPVTPTAPTTERSSRTIPFTGLDLALLTVGGGPLLLIGIGSAGVSPPPPRPGSLVADAADRDNCSCASGRHLSAAARRARPARAARRAAEAPARRGLGARTLLSGRLPARCRRTGVGARRPSCRHPGSPGRLARALRRLGSGRLRGARDVPAEASRRAARGSPRRGCRDLARRDGRTDPARGLHRPFRPGGAGHPALGLRDGLRSRRPGRAPLVADAGASPRRGAPADSDRGRRPDRTPHGEAAARASRARAPPNRLPRQGTNGAPTETARCCRCSGRAGISTASSRSTACSR